MLRRIASALLLATVLGGTAHAYVPPAISARAGQPEPSGTLWSTLGVVADGTTDNTAALNALTTGTQIIGDCPGGSFIRVNSAWNWQSNLNLWIRAGCQIVSYVTGSNNYAITQTDLNTPLTNVTVYGLDIKKGTAPATGERILRVWVDGFKLIKWTFGDNCGGMFVRGSNQEIAFGRQYNSCTATGSPGIRHIGNVPTVATGNGYFTGTAMPKNVWIHDNHIQSGDTAFQTAQPLNGATWVNVSTNGILWENNYGNVGTSALIAIGLDNGVPADMAFSVSDVTYRNMAGIGGNRGILIEAGDNVANVVSGITIQDVTIDASSDATTSASIEVMATYTSSGTISNVTMNRVSILQPYQRSLHVDGAVSNLTFQNGYLGNPRNGGQDNVAVSGTDITVSTSTIGNLAGNNVVVGDANITTSATIDSNVLLNVSNNRSGVLLQNADNSLVDSNVMFPKFEATSARGITFAADPGGAHDSLATGNDVSRMTNSPTIVFVCGQGNNATSNTGSPDYSC